MIKIKSGVSKLCFSILILFTFSCEDKRNLVSIEGNIVSILKNDSLNLIIELHDNGNVKKMISKRKDSILVISYFDTGLINEYIPTLAGKKHGEYLLYDESGRIKKKVKYKEGSRHGDTFEFFYDTYSLSQRLYENDDAIYSSVYMEGEKIFNSPIPVFEDEIFDSSSYEALITFPFKFKGKIEIYFRDSLDFDKTLIDKYNMRLRINNFKNDWPQYEIRLVYEPSEDDTLIETDFVYNRSIDSDRVK